MVEKIEHERKFILTPEKYVNLMKVVEAIDDHSSPSTFHRHYVYYDTTDSFLYSHGQTVSIRQREKDCVLMHKIPIGNDMQVRKESSYQLVNNTIFVINKPLPDAALDYLQSTDFNPRDLRGVLEMDVVNSRIKVGKSSPPILELSLAKCKGTLNGQEYATMYEAEIEIQKGTEKDLINYCKRFLSLQFLEETNLNKYQRMMKLLSDREEKIL